MPTLEETIIAARKDFSERNWKKAIEKYSTVIDTSPFILNVYMERHFCFTELSKHREALEDLQSIIHYTSCFTELREDTEQLFELRADAFYYSGEQLSQLMEWDASIDAYEENVRILDFLPERNAERILKKAATLFKSGLILRDKKEYIPEAIEHFSKSIDICQKLLHFRGNKGKRVAIENHLKQTYFARGICYEKMEDYESAMGDYLHLGDFPGNFYIGKMYFYAIQLEDAERHLETCMGIPNTQEEIKVQAAKLLYQTRLALQLRINN